MKKDHVGDAIFTRGIPAAFSWLNPGVSVADCALGHMSAGHTELLPHLPISLSTEPTGLSLHPVHNLNLEEKHITQHLHLIIHIIKSRLYYNFLFYLQSIHVKVDFLKTIKWSMQSNALTSLSNMNLA